jgi:hypothetical protein
LPHYKDGSPAQHGDLVIKSEKHEGSLEVAGVVAQITNGESCNAQLMPLAIRQKGVMTWMPTGFVGGLWYVTLADCMKVDVAMLSVAAEIDTVKAVNEAATSG